MTRKERLEDVLSQHFNPTLMKIMDETHDHHVPQGMETHFNLLIVSPKFESLSKIDRHRAVHRLLAVEFETGLHALSLHLCTPKEWEEKQGQSFSSPPCRGGFDHD